MRCRFFSLLLLVTCLAAQDRKPPCTNCATWNIPQKPFRVYGNTYYVGTHGLSSVLITSGAGHILIDAALPESAPLIAASIRALGFRVEDIKLIVNSHAHFDHAGGVSELQKLSGARVAASRWTAGVMKRGLVPSDDPQFGAIAPIARVGRVETFEDGATLKVGDLKITAHLTPGHTPGGTSWTWQSCENNRCLNLVYADSLSPVSSDGYLFSHRKEHPNGPDDFEHSFAFLDTTPCDILVTPHPEGSGLWQHLEQRDKNPDALVDSNACRTLAGNLREGLKKRLAAEKTK